MPALPNTDDDGHQNADLRMTLRAIREGWDIPEAVMKAWPAEIVKIVMGKDSAGKHRFNTRDRIAAMKLMVTMHGQNQDDDPAPQKVLLGRSDGIPEATAKLLQDQEVRNALLRAAEKGAHAPTLPAPQQPSG